MILSGILFTWINYTYSFIFFCLFFCKRFPCFKQLVGFVKVVLAYHESFLLISEHCLIMSLLAFCGLLVLNGVEIEPYKYRV